MNMLEMIGTVKVGAWVYIRLNRFERGSPISTNEKNLQLAHLRQELTIGLGLREALDQ